MFLSNLQHIGTLYSAPCSLSNQRARSRSCPRLRGHFLPGTRSCAVNKLGSADDNTPVALSKIALGVRSRRTEETSMRMPHSDWARKQRRTAEMEFNRGKGLSQEIASSGAPDTTAQSERNRGLSSSTAAALLESLSLLPSVPLCYELERAV